MIWHLNDTKAVLENLGSSPHGLSAEIAEKRAREHGLNQLQEGKKLSPFMMLVHQFKDFMILILLAAAVVSGIVGDLTDTIIILVIVLLNALTGFIQEYRAEKAVEALRQLATPQANVVRGGQTQQLSAIDLVPGDIVLLEAGNMVPADLRLLESFSLRVEESSLTGESVPVDKISEVIAEEDVSLGDQLNMAFKSTMIAGGRGSGVVVATGMNTEIGKIAGMLQEKGVQTPLQRRMADFGKKLTVLIIIICIVLFGVGLLRGEEPVYMLLVAISLAVAAIPEALPALITISLARGAKRLVKKNALIRKLPAVETLGSVDFICSDKTGTLTQNKMTVVDVIPLGLAASLHDELSALELAMALNHDVQEAKDGQWTGDPTEIALVDYIDKQYNKELLKQLQSTMPRVEEIPFDSERKCMTTIHKSGEEYIAFSKGAVETIAENLSDKNGNKGIFEQANKMAANGLRVLAFAYRKFATLPENVNVGETEVDLIFLGLVGMIDPPREEAKKAINACKTAGIRPVMITGDHVETATAVARELAMVSADDLVVSGSQMAKMSQEELDEKIERISVYARVSPEQKLTIVKTLQRHHHYVAMTGDGVNDAPSLKMADIGVAMGITGTDVSKESAHMILLDDNFATIVKAIEEGRRVYDNIRKFVKYIMTCNSAEILTIFIAPLLGLPIPLLPIHILWINLVTDGLPGLALSSEKAERNIMTRSPRKAGESLFADGTGIHIIWVGILMAAVTLGTQAYAINTSNTHWQTMVFTVLSLAQLGHVYAIRSSYELIYKSGTLSNLPLVGAVLFTFLLQLGVIYLPFANEIFGTKPLSLYELLACIGAAAIVFHAVELEKWIKRRSAKRHSNTNDR